MEQPEPRLWEVARLWHESDRAGRVYAVLYLLFLLAAMVTGSFNVILLVMILFAWQSLWFGRIRSQALRVARSLDEMQAWIDGWESINEPECSTPEEGRA